MARTVIDVSYAQPNVQWEKVKPQIDGAILRCGYGSDQANQDDKQWARNVSECERLGIPYGVYLYSYADSDAKIQSEIDHALRLIKGHKPVLGVFYDLEENRYGSVAARAAKEWCRRISSAGYTPGIYCGAYFYRQWMPGVHEQVNALWWIAAYGSNTGSPQYSYKPKPGFDIDAWQYTSVRTFNGISGGVDTSEWYTWSAAPSIAYRAHVQTYGWLDAVADGVTSGTTGEGKRLEAIKITPPDGWELEVAVHLQGIGDKVYKGIKKGKSSGRGSSVTDPIVGSVGEGRRMEAIRIHAVKKTGSGQLKYRVHMQGIGWGPWCSDNQWAGTKGEARRIEAIQIKIG